MKLLDKFADLAATREQLLAQGPLPFGVVVRGLDQWLDSIEAQPPPILVGSSMGAWLAMLRAYHRPEFVSRVTARMLAGQGDLLPVAEYEHGGF